MTSANTQRATLAPDRETVADAIEIASRAPSLHNTQPWRWVFDGTLLQLYGDTDRQLFATDPHGREWMISCGVVLHHACTVFAALGWHTEVTRLPDRDRPDLIATIGFEPWPDPPAAILARAGAIERRYSDRLPMGEPTGWATVAPALRGLTMLHGVAFEVIAPQARPRVVAASEQAAKARGYDMMYRDELDWWTGHTEISEGVPEGALPSSAELARMDIARDFPLAPHSARRAEMTDHAQLVLLGTADETPPHWLHTGEALSAVLLECTARGLSTCALTHITELPAARRALADILPHRTLAQVLIRIGTAPEGDRPSATPRRPLADILTFR